MQLLCFESIDSTNAYLKRELRSRALSGTTAAIASTQTAGVGRFGRAWSSPRGGVWLSLAIRVEPLIGPEQEVLRGLGLRVGLAVLDAIRSAFSREQASQFKLKWPNDVVVTGPSGSRRKVAGVLIERATVPGDQHPWLILGVGINANVSDSDLPEPLRSRTTSLRSISGRDIDLDALANRTLEVLISAVTRQRLTPELIVRSMDDLAGLGESVSLAMPGGGGVGGGEGADTLTGKLLGIDSREGTALLLLPNGDSFAAPPGSVIMDADAS